MPFDNMNKAGAFLFQLQDVYLFSQKYLNLVFFIKIFGNNSIRSLHKIDITLERKNTS